MIFKNRKGGRYLGEKKALQLKASAKQTIGNSKGDVYLFQIRILTQNLRSLRRQIENT